MATSRTRARMNQSPTGCSSHLSSRSRWFAFACWCSSGGFMCDRAAARPCGPSRTWQWRTRRTPDSRSCRNTTRSGLPCHPARITRQSNPVALITMVESSRTSTRHRILERLVVELTTALQQRSPVAIRCISIRLRCPVSHTSTRLLPQRSWAPWPTTRQTPCTRARGSCRMREFTKRSKPSITPSRARAAGAAPVTMYHLPRYTWRMVAARPTEKAPVVHPTARRLRGCTPTPTRLELYARISTPGRIESQSGLSLLRSMRSSVSDAMRCQWPSTTRLDPAKSSGLPSIVAM